MKQSLAINKLTFNEHKKILMISYPFPPLGVAGSIRPYRFVKYLPNFSWEPIVLTINERNDVPKDYSLLQRLSKNVRVVRARYFDPLLFIK